jgi:hypothetical protein
MRIPAAKDFWAGLMFIGFGLVFAWMASGYSLGRAGRMGPGYFPLALSIVLLTLGAVIVLRALALRSAPVAGLRVLPLALLTVAIVAFGLVIEPVGLIAAVPLVTVIAARAGPEFRWLEAAGLALALLVFSAIVFVYGLGLPLKLWPGL